MGCELEHQLSEPGDRDSGLTAGHPGRDWQLGTALSSTTLIML